MATHETALIKCSHSNHEEPWHTPLTAGGVTNSKVYSSNLHHVYSPDPKAPCVLNKCTTSTLNNVNVVKQILKNLKSVLTPLHKQVCDQPIDYNDFVVESNVMNVLQNILIDWNDSDWNEITLHDTVWQVLGENHGTQVIGNPSETQPKLNQ